MSSCNESSQHLRANFDKAERAIESGDINSLKDILNTLPNFNTLVDYNGSNLLYLSIDYVEEEIFSYLLSLNCFDLDATNYMLRTPLDKVFEDCDRIDNCDYYGTSLIQRGANIDRVLYDNRTYLHLATEKNLLEIAETLILKGVDLNAQDEEGRTPLHEACRPPCDTSGAGVYLLLYHGADATLCDWVTGYEQYNPFQNYLGLFPFDYGVINSVESSALEHLFHHTFDSLSGYRIPAKVLSTLIEMNSPLIEKVMEVVTEVLYTYEPDFEPFHIFGLKPKLLKFIINNHGSFMRKVLIYDRSITVDENISSLEKWEILLNSDLRSETIELIGKLKLVDIVLLGFANDVDNFISEEIIDVIFYLFSYGLNVDWSDYKFVFKELGYCDVFKMMLHVTGDVDRFKLADVPMVRMICDIHDDLEDLLPNIGLVPVDGLRPLLDYFANARLRLLCESSDDAGLVTRAKELPTVPSLVELARNSTRRLIVERCGLKKISQYYSFLKRLPISTTHQKILSFETKLYE